MAKRAIYLNNPNLPSIEAEFEYTPKMVSEIHRCNLNVLYFAENFFYIINVDEGKQTIQLHPYQKKALRMMRDNRFSLLLFSRQTGKALDEDTPIPTPTGWVRNGDIKEGEYVFDEHGKPCKVLYAHEPLYDRDCYKVTFDNGEEIVADSSHIWFTQTSTDRKSKRLGGDKTTLDILNSLLKSDGSPNHRIPYATEGVEYTEKELPIKKSRNRWHYIKSVEKVESRPVRCITVDNPTGLYLAGKTSIPTHNSTISTIYCLWVACFNNDQNILVVANKESTAKEIFKRIRMAYEGLPNWLKPAVREYQKESMELANGSRIGITTTTGTAGRGSSANLLFCDEADWIECVAPSSQIQLWNEKPGETKKISIGEAWNTTQEEKLNPSDWKILTDNGWKSFGGFIKNENINSVKIEFTDGTELICSEDHELLCYSGNYTTAQKSRNKKIVSEEGFKTVKSVKKNGKIDAYDVTDVEGGRYITNGIVSHNCGLLNEFWASVYPIISSSKKSKIIMASTPRDTSGLFYKLYDGSCKGTNNWASLKITWDQVPGRDDIWKRETVESLGDPALFRREFECEFDQVGDSSIDVDMLEKMKLGVFQPLYVMDDGKYSIWEIPNENRIYVAGVDISEGLGKDSTVVQILDITDLKRINQVAMYSNNQITPSEFTAKLNEILQHWGNPIALIERNGCGGQVVDNLKKDFHYDNIVSYGYKEDNRVRQLGVMSHTNTKYKGVMNQRYWINTLNCVQINDMGTIIELKDFVRNKNGTWSAKSGSHDDRVMSLIWALVILSDDLVETYFEVIELDDNRKPMLIRPLDYGVKYFANPRSIYSNEKDGVSKTILPSLFSGNNPESSDPEMDDLISTGWVSADSYGGNSQNFW